MIYSASGTLIYSYEQGAYKLIVEVDEELASYYRSMVPAHCGVRKQKYSPHVTVVRNEVPAKAFHWGKWHLGEVVFCYSSIIKFNPVYCWLDVFSSRLEEIRWELGLARKSEQSRPPDGADCFHMTLGNFKDGKQ